MRSRSFASQALPARSGLETWSEVKRICDTWAEQIAARLRELRSRR